MRRALFDAMLTGCVPVVFHPSTIDTYRPYLGDPSLLAVLLDPAPVLEAFERRRSPSSSSRSNSTTTTRGSSTQKRKRKEKTKVEDAAGRRLASESAWANFVSIEGGDVLQHLSRLATDQPQRVRALRQRVAEVAHRLQYSEIGIGIASQQGSGEEDAFETMFLIAQERVNRKAGSCI